MFCFLVCLWYCSVLRVRSWLAKTAWPIESKLLSKLPASYVIFWIDLMCDKKFAYVYMRVKGFQRKLEGDSAKKTLANSIIFHNFKKTSRKWGFSLKSPRWGNLWTCGQCQNLWTLPLRSGYMPLWSGTYCNLAKWWKSEVFILILNSSIDFFHTGLAKYKQFSWAGEKDILKFKWVQIEGQISTKR